MIHSIGYRTKGPDGTKTTCALILSVPLLRLMGNPERCSVTVMPRGREWKMTIKPFPSGYSVNFKRPGSTGEINIAWAKLDAEPANASGKGRLPCRWDDVNQYLTVDISSWKERYKPQDTLFGEQGRELKP